MNRKTIYVPWRGFFGGLASLLGIGGIALVGCWLFVMGLYALILLEHGK